MTTPPTTPQARCEQIAREITSGKCGPYIEAFGVLELRKEITTALLAAEERGRQEERFRKHDPVAVKVAVDAMWEKVRQQQSEPTRECVEIAREITEKWLSKALTSPWLDKKLQRAIAAALQAERAKLASVEESARRVIEQAVQVLATRPITGERHTVLTELEAWLAEHLVPVKPCPEGDGEK